METIPPNSCGTCLFVTFPCLSLDLLSDFCCKTSLFDLTESLLAALELSAAIPAGGADALALESLVDFLTLDSALLSFRLGLNMLTSISELSVADAVRRVDTICSLCCLAEFRRRNRSLRSVGSCLCVCDVRDICMTHVEINVNVFQNCSVSILVADFQMSLNKVKRSKKD